MDVGLSREDSTEDTQRAQLLGRLKQRRKVCRGGEGERRRRKGSGSSQGRPVSSN